MLKLLISTLHSFFILEDLKIYTAADSLRGGNDILITKSILLLKAYR